MKPVQLCIAFAAVGALAQSKTSLDETCCYVNGRPGQSCEFDIKLVLVIIVVLSFSYQIFHISVILVDHHSYASLQKHHAEKCCCCQNT